MITKEIWILVTCLICAVVSVACGENAQLGMEKTPEIEALSQPAADEIAVHEKDTSNATLLEDLTASIDPLEAVDTEESPDPAALVITDTEQLHLDELVVARGVEKRKPLEPGTRFKVDPEKRIYAFMRVANPEALENRVTVSWINEETGRERGTIAVSVGPQKKWRTWAYTRNVRTPGKWKVVVRNSDGEVIAEAPFEMTEDV